MEPDLADALRAYQGGAFPEERLRELVHRLRTDSAFREVFGDAVWILGLSRLAQAPEPRWTGLCEEMGWLNPGSAAGDPRGENPGAVEGFENLERVLGEVRREPAPYVRAWWRRAAVLALAACLVLLALPRRSFRGPTLTSEPTRIERFSQTAPSAETTSPSPPPAASG